MTLPKPDVLAEEFLKSAAQEAGRIAMKQFLIKIKAIPPDLSEQTVQSLLDRFMARLKDRLDEDRTAKLYGAFLQLQDASQVEDQATRKQILTNAIVPFSEIASIPQQGQTGGFSNGQLRCLAYLGLVAIYTILNENPKIIADKVASAIYADYSIAATFLERKLVLQLFPLKNWILSGHTQFLTHLCFSSDGRFLVSCHWPTPTIKLSPPTFDPTQKWRLKVWDALSGDFKWGITVAAPIHRAVAISPDMKYVAYDYGFVGISGIFKNSRIDVRYLATGVLKKSLAFPPGEIVDYNAMAFSSDSNHLLVEWKKSGEIPNYSVLRTINIGRINADDNRLESPVGFSPDSSMYLTYTDAWGDKEGRITFWEIATRSPIRSFEVPGDPLTVIYAPNGRWLSCKCKDGKIRVCDAYTGEIGWTFTLPKDNPYSTTHALSPDGITIAYSAYSNGKIPGETKIYLSRMR